MEELCLQIILQFMEKDTEREMCIGKEYLNLTSSDLTILEGLWKYSQ
jgi:hypothetical protein